MKLFPKFYPFVVLVCAAVCAGPASAQRPGANAVSAKSAPGTYDIAKDVSLQGTVLTFTENSQTPPLGAHVLLQTSAGNVHVHLADERFPHLSNLNIPPSPPLPSISQITPPANNPTS